MRSRERYVKQFPEDGSVCTLPTEETEKCTVNEECCEWGAGREGRAQGSRGCQGDAKHRRTSQLPAAAWWPSGASGTSAAPPAGWAWRSGTAWSRWARRTAPCARLRRLRQRSAWCPSAVSRRGRGDRGPQQPLPLSRLGRCKRKYGPPPPQSLQGTSRSESYRCEDIIQTQRVASFERHSEQCWGGKLVASG